jgi:hypothetical protein
MQKLGISITFMRDMGNGKQEDGKRELSGKQEDGKREMGVGLST